MSIEYDIYLNEHISNVQKGLEFFKTRMPELLMVVTRRKRSWTTLTVHGSTIFTIIRIIGSIIF